MESIGTARAPLSGTVRSQARKQAALASLKRSQFLVGLARALRGLIGDMRVLVWTAKRKRLITDYLESHNVKKLQLGASNNLLPGWLNTDICLNHPSVAYLDVTRPFPFDNNTFDYIISEHMIEHIQFQAAKIMLTECYRVLRPGGRVRFATPDLRVLLALHAKEKTDAQRYYINWAVDRFMPDVHECRDVFVINNFFQSWGHCFLYDQETLCYALHTAGFRETKFYRPGASEDLNLQNLEFHGKELQSEDINQFETIVVEGYKEK
jgi:predicted SAM-dependent methyltransferase